MGNASDAHTMGAFGKKQFSIKDVIVKDKTGALLPHKQIVGIVRPTKVLGKWKPRFLRGKPKIKPTGRSSGFSKSQDISVKPANIKTKQKGFKGAVSRIFSRKAGDS